MFQGFVFFAPYAVLGFLAFLVSAFPPCLCVSVADFEVFMHHSKKHAFEPKIVAFVCTWCTYAGADLAGTSRLQYPANVRVLKFPCTGRIDPVFILRAFQKGADGVLVSGCHPGDCHYMAGNLHARRRFAAFRALIEFVGVDLDRLQFSWVSAAEGGKWVEVVTELTDRVRAMGPMAEFKELELEECWSGKLDTPELKEAYNNI